jgi:hypothetical protein
LPSAAGVRPHPLRVRNPRLIAAWVYATAGDLTKLQPPVNADGRHSPRRLIDLLKQPVHAGINPPAKPVWHCSIHNHPSDPTQAVCRELEQRTAPRQPRPRMAPLPAPSRAEQSHPPKPQRPARLAVDLTLPRLRQRWLGHTPGLDSECPATLPRRTVSWVTAGHGVPGCLVCCWWAQRAETS